MRFSSVAFGLPYLLIECGRTGSRANVTTKIYRMHSLRAHRARESSAKTSKYWCGQSEKDTQKTVKLKR